MSRQRLSLTALLLLLAGPVLAQRFTAAIRGNVTDPSHAVIAGGEGHPEERRNRPRPDGHDQRGRELLLRRSARGDL